MVLEVSMLPTASFSVTVIIIPKNKRRCKKRMSPLSEYSRAQSSITLSRNAIFSRARSNASRQTGQFPSKPLQAACGLTPRAFVKSTTNCCASTPWTREQCEQIVLVRTDKGLLETVCPN